MNRIVLFSLILLFSACSQGFGNKLEHESIDVYFEFKNDEMIAEELGKFWIKEELTGSVKQSIRLTKDNDFYYIQLITNEKTDLNELPIPERKLLLDLQHKMDSIIFNDEKRCQIEICNNEFEPLYNINQ